MEFVNEGFKKMNICLKGMLYTKQTTVYLTLPLPFLINQITQGVHICFLNRIGENPDILQDRKRSHAPFIGTWEQ